MNSMLDTWAPTRSAIARPSPRLEGGLEVCSHTSPHPPVASMVAWATMEHTAMSPALPGLFSSLPRLPFPPPPTALAALLPFPKPFPRPFPLPFLCTATAAAGWSSPRERLRFNSLLLTRTTAPPQRRAPGTFPSTSFAASVSLSAVDAESSTTAPALLLLPSSSSRGWFNFSPFTTMRSRAVAPRSRVTRGWASSALTSDSIIALPVWSPQ
mmetsp:Transcript_87991/g.176002  ORF Transcript_87991/g.176002 Transcript_87991/m.176002 type:complete len:212 (-) Transcript_87991:634-1269(-)